MMTVRELIEQLADHNPDATVYSKDEANWPIDTIRTDTDYDGTPMIILQ